MMKDWIRTYDFERLYRIFPSRLGSQTGRFLLMSGFEKIFVDDPDDITVAVIRQGDDMIAGGNQPGTLKKFFRKLDFRGLLEAPRSFDKVISSSIPEAVRLPRSGWYIDRPVKMPVIRGVESRRLELEESLMIHSLGEKWIMKHNRTPIDFLYNHDVFGVFKEGNLVSVCCKFTWSGEYVELAAVTHPEYRGHGYGRLAAAAAVNYQTGIGKTVIWNCFSNNRASVRVAESLEFIPYEAPDYMYSVNWQPEGTGQP